MTTFGARAGPGIRPPVRHHARRGRDHRRGPGRRPGGDRRPEDGGADGARPGHRRRGQPGDGRPAGRLPVPRLAPRPRGRARCGSPATTRRVATDGRSATEAAGFMENATLVSEVTSMPNGPDIDTEVPPSGPGCVECTAADGWWFHLRRCAHCGHVGCCEFVAVTARQPPRRERGPPGRPELRARRGLVLGLRARGGLRRSGAGPAALAPARPARPRPGRPRARRLAVPAALTMTMPEADPSDHVDHPYAREIDDERRAGMRSARSSARCAASRVPRAQVPARPGLDGPRRRRPPRYLARRSAGPVRADQRRDVRGPRGRYRRAERHVPGGHGRPALGRRVDQANAGRSRMVTEWHALREPSNEAAWSSPSRGSTTTPSTSAA